MVAMSTIFFCILQAALLSVIGMNAQVLDKGQWCMEATARGMQRWPERSPFMSDEAYKQMLVEAHFGDV